MLVFRALLTVTVTFYALAEINLNQVQGLRALLQGEHHDFIATCNIALFKPLVDYDTATQKCADFQVGGNGRRGNLATVNDEEKNDDLVTLLEMAYPVANVTAQYEGIVNANQVKWQAEMWVWAGLHKTRNNNAEVENTGMKGWPTAKYDWEWIHDGSQPLDYAPWYNKKQPDQAILTMDDDDRCPEEQCFQNQMRINHDGLWDDTWKFMRHPYACDYQGKYLISTSMKTWVDARDACENAGLHLAKVRNSAELAEIIDAIHYFAGDGVSDGGSKMKTRWHPRNWIWVGGNDIEEEGTWRWLDGELVEESWDVPFPWMQRAGNDDSMTNNGGQDALALNRQGKFDDSFTNKRRAQNMRMFACQCPGT